MERHRIALVTESFYPAVDGTTATVKAVADRLIDTGHDVLLVAPGPGLTTYRRSTVARIRPRDKPGGQVRDALTAFRPDLVHVTSPGPLGRKALKHARRLGVPTVVAQQSPVSDLAADYWLLKVAERADRMLVTAPWMVSRLAALGTTAELWTPGVDARAFSPTLRDEWLHDKWARASSAAGPQVVVGYVGSLHKRHGVRHLTETAAVPNVRLVVIGDGPQGAWLRSRLPSAKFTGPLGTGDLAVAMASLDVLVHPGDRETCCHAVREAMASGVPVVAPRSGGARDLVAPLETGLLYDAGHPRDLIRALSCVVGDRQRSQLGAAGRRRVLDRDWTVAVDELVSCHYPAAGARHASAPAA